MVNKYVRVLEQREINQKTNYTWAIMDVPTTWRDRVADVILSDGYEFDEDGTVIKKEPEDGLYGDN